MISKNRILDIKKSNSWYQKINLIFYIKKSFFIYKNQTYFLISRIWDFDITNSIFDIKKLDWFFNNKNSIYWFIDIKNSKIIFDIKKYFGNKKSISWYKKIDVKKYGINSGVCTDYVCLYRGKYTISLYVVRYTLFIKSISDGGRLVFNMAAMQISEMVTICLSV